MISGNVKAEWANLIDIKAEYPSASIVGNDRMKFNIKGNSYKLIVKLNFDCQIVWIRFIGTHAEYDKIIAKKINMNIKPIKTKRGYEQAMLKLENLFDAKKGTPKGDELEILSLLIEKYEGEKFPIN